MRQAQPRVLGAVPEALQTAHGSLTTGLDAQPGQTRLVRGGTSSVGMAAAVLAKRMGLEVVSTTRSPAKAARLREIGVDHVVIDDGEVAPKLRRILPAGADVALELVGAPTLRETLRTLKVHGVACFTAAALDPGLIPLDRVFPLDQIGAAHDYMEQNLATGRIVVVP